MTPKCGSSPRTPFVDRVTFVPELAMTHPRGRGAGLRKLGVKETGSHIVTSWGGLRVCHSCEFLLLLDAQEGWQLAKRFRVDLGQIVCLTGLVRLHLHVPHVDGSRCGRE